MLDVRSAITNVLDHTTLADVLHRIDSARERIPLNLQFF
jgi:hypothetical protein